MRLLLATNHLGLGGSESYLLTVAEQLDRLGHEAVVYAPELEDGVEAARERGIVVAGEAALEVRRHCADELAAASRGVQHLLRPPHDAVDVGPISCQTAILAS